MTDTDCEVVHTIKIKRYADNAVRFTFTTDGVAVDFSTATAAKLSVRKDYESDLLFEVAATNGQDGNVWLSGIFKFEIPREDSALLDQDGVYDVLVITGGKWRKIHGGIVRFVPNVFEPEVIS